jgi:predicted nucleic acid-binding protein
MERPAHELIVDASVVVKWFVPEIDSPESIVIRDHHVDRRSNLFAPDLLVFELANALRYRSSLKENDLSEAIASFFALDIGLISPTPDSLVKTVTLAKALNLTAYDAAYLELAESLDCRLVTADRSLWERASSSEKRNRVILFKDYVSKNLQEDVNPGPTNQNSK